MDEQLGIAEITTIGGMGRCVIGRARLEQPMPCASPDPQERVNTLPTRHCNHALASDVVAIEGQIAADVPRIGILIDVIQEIRCRYNAAIISGRNLSENGAS